MRRVRPGRRRQKDDYLPLRERYLVEHPLCQVTIARLGLDEAEVLRAFEADDDGAPGFPTWAAGFHYRGRLIPFARQIHHRNKSRGARLNDVRFWMSADPAAHDWVEDGKEAARATGFLLPLEADAEGRLPDGTACQQTPDFMRSRAGALPL